MSFAFDEVDEYRLLIFEGSNRRLALSIKIQNSAIVNLTVKTLAGAAAPRPSIVAAPLCWGVLRAGERGSGRVLHRLGGGGVPWLQPAEPSTKVGTLGEPALPLVFAHAGAAAPRPSQLVGKPHRRVPTFWLGARGLKPRIV